METSEQECIQEIAELLSWGNNINIDDIYEMSVLDFYILRQVFREKYVKEQEAKQRLVETSFEFAKKAVEVICKTTAGAYGTKSNTNSLK